MLVFTCGNRGGQVFDLEAAGAGDDNNSGSSSLRAIFKQNFDDECKFFNLSSDGNTLAYANRKGVHLVEVPTLQHIRSLPFERVQGLSFSPKCTYLSIYTSYLCKPNEQPPPNLFIVNRATGETVHSYVQRSQSGWEPQWFADESYLARAFSNTIMLYEPADLTRHVKQVNVERIQGFALSPSIGDRKYVACYVPTSGKGQPAFARLFNVDQPKEVLASKSFFKCDNVTFKWNPKGTDVLILATTEVDKTNTSYYGEQALHFANVKGYSCIVQLKKKGPIYSSQWNGDTFCVVYGFMPAKATVFNLKCDPIWDLEDSPRNLVCYNPQGNILLTAGLGNLQGTVETWDVEQRKRIGFMKMPDTTHIEFAADGIHILAATLAPRLRVNNGFKVWHYSGALKTEVVAVKDDPNSFVEMWQANLQREAPGKHPKPVIVFKKVEGIAQTAPKASKQAYRPPAARALEEAKKEEQKKNKNKKKSKSAKTPEAQQTVPTVNPALTKIDEDDRKARAIKKKLSQIYVLKQRLDAGETLEPEQLEKISCEQQLSDELKQLELC